MAEYIRRDFLLELAREYYSQGLKEKAVPVTAIRNIPSADVQPVVHGEWLVRHDPWGDNEYYNCSCCGDAFVLLEGTPKDNNYKFCPNCGARMDGGT